MRILVDYRPALRSRTGVGEYIRQLVQAYTAAYSDDVSLFTSSWKDRPSSNTSTELGARVVDKRVPVSLLNYLWHRTQWPPVEWLAGEHDVVHAAHPLLIPSHRAAQVVTIHDLFFLDHPEQTKDEIQRDYPLLAPDHARRADAVITSSLHTQKLLRQRLGVAEDRVYCCPPGAPRWTTLGKTPQVRQDGYILFLGTLEPRKNIPLLLDVFARLAERGADAPRLVLAGWAGPAAQPWLVRAAQKPLAGLVTHLGYVANEAREQLFAGARALVLPSLDEGFGLPALEAMSAGVPVLASDRGALPEVIAHGGVLLDVDDTNAWVAAIWRVTRDDAWARELGAAGLDRAKAFTWPRSAERLRQAYADAVTRRGER